MGPLTEHELKQIESRLGWLGIHEPQNWRDVQRLLDEIRGRRIPHSLDLPPEGPCGEACLASLEESAKAELDADPGIHDGLPREVGDLAGLRGPQAAFGTGLSGLPLQGPPFRSTTGSSFVAGSRKPRTRRVTEDEKGVVDLANRYANVRGCHPFARVTMCVKYSSSLREAGFEDVPDEELCPL